MASKPLLPFHFIKSQVLKSSYASIPILIQYQDNISIQLIWSGTPVGVFTVSISNNYDPNTERGVFDIIPLSPTIMANGAADSAFLDGNQLSGVYLKLNYTFISGNGVLDGYTTAKGV